MCFRVYTLIYVFICAPLYAQEFVYVTDSLKLRLYSAPDDSSSVLLILESGDSVELLETQNGFSQVIAYDGSKGWVKSAFLVTEPPAKLLYYSVSEQNKELQTKIEALQAKSPVSSTENSTAHRKQIEELQTALAKEQEKNLKLQEQIDEQMNMQVITGTKSSAHLQNDINEAISDFANEKWIIPGSVAVLLLLGFLFGIKISAWRMRKRLHGFRLK